MMYLISDMVGIHIQYTHMYQGRYKHVANIVDIRVAIYIVKFDGWNFCGKGLSNTNF